METLSPTDAVRKRPGMYVGSADDGSGIVHMVLEVLANAYDQYLADRCSTISIIVAADGTISIEDNGPGLRAAGGDGLPAIDVLLSRHFDLPTVDGHRPHVHLGVGGVGLFVVNALSERFELVTVHDGVEARTTYARGALVEPLVTAASQRANGTAIRFRPDPSIFPHSRVPRAELTRVLEDLTFLAPRLRLKWAFDGDDVSGHGLVGRVAVRVPCSLAEVAHHRATYETPKGPIDIDVALAWRAPVLGIRPDAPVIESFVNLAWTRGEGSHVDGLIDGARAFLGSGQRRPQPTALVAAVAVILADVIYGNPSKDRLDSPEAREPVAEATQVALTRWASMFPDVATALRARHELEP